MRGQISLEFLVVLAAYLAFLAVLISSQLHYIDQKSFVNTSAHMNARSLAIIVSEQLINNYYLAVPIDATNCITNKTSVTCDSGETTVDFPLSCDRCDSYGKTPLS